MHVAMLARHHHRELAAVGGHAQALAHGFHQLHTARFVGDVARQFFGTRRALAEVVAQAGEAHR